MAMHCSFAKRSCLRIDWSLISSFDRNQPATEVYVTGTFDDWAQSVKLEKKGDTFEKKLDLALTDEKIYYKVRNDVSVIST